MSLNAKGVTSKTRVKIGLFYIRLILLLLVAANRAISTDKSGAVVFYVSTQGNDAWSGKLSEPNADRSDGPFATVAGARDAIRKLKSSRPLSGAVNVYLRGGTYNLDEPLVFTTADSGTDNFPITYSRYENEVAILSGGRAITGWSKSREGPIWQTKVLGVREGNWYFHELFVNGQRRQRARAPNVGFLHVDGNVISAKPLRFKFRGADIKRQWAGNEDVDIVIPRAWTVVRYHIAGVDPLNRVATLSNDDVHWVEESGSRYWIENSLDALDEPGEWCLDRHSGLLYYWPLRGEDMAHVQVIAPVLQQLVRFKGDTWGSDRPGGSALAIDAVHDIRLNGLSFRYTDWSMAANGYADKQGGFELPGAIELTAATSVEITNSVLENLGQFAIELGKACQKDFVVGNELSDIGGGGIKIGEPKDPNTDTEATVSNVISDNRIHDLGLVDPGADAVWIGESSGNTVSHNDIYKTNHSGIAVGWTWGYLPTAAFSNTISFNDIHEIGQGMMGDLGCIYLLGVQPDTVVINNVCHDVTHADGSYGAWGIYTDEGSSKITIEDNVVFRTEDAGYHHHYGQNNIIRNNIFALGKMAQLRRTDDEPGHSFDFEHNIVYWTEGTLLDQSWSNNEFHFDNNLYFYAGGGGVSAINFEGLTLEQWQARGQDVHSIVGDPMFVDPSHGDFTFRPNSPALKIGFEPISVNSVGPRTPSGAQ